MRAIRWPTTPLRFRFAVLCQGSLVGIVEWWRERRFVVEGEINPVRLKIVARGRPERAAPDSIR
jgi:hypothetical protein